MAENLKLNEELIKALMSQGAMEPDPVGEGWYTKEWGDPKQGWAIPTEKQGGPKSILQGGARGGADAAGVGGLAGGRVSNKEDFNRVDFYDSLEQNYRKSPEGEAELHGVGAASGAIVKYLESIIPGLLETGKGYAKTGVNSLAEFVTKPAGFQGSQPAGMSYANAHSKIDELIVQNDVVNTLSDYLSEEFGGVQSIYPNKMLK